MIVRGEGDVPEDLAKLLIFGFKILLDIPSVISDLFL